MDNRTYLIRGINASIYKKSLSPLLKALEICLQDSRAKSQFRNTIFSSDSFMLPHLKTQVSFLKSLKTAFEHDSISFVNYPIGSYVVFDPKDLERLRQCHFPTKLLEVNSLIIAEESNCFIENGLPVIDEFHNIESQQMAEYFETLIGSVPYDAWDELKINGFNFHEIAIMDLGLNYKAGPELGNNTNDPFFEHLINCKFHNLFLLCLLIVNSDKIGGKCYFMSMYSSELVFQYFCQCTSRDLKHFFPPPSCPNIEEFGITTSEYILVNECPNSIVNLTSLPIVSHLNKSELSEYSASLIEKSIDKRLLGTDSHTYSCSVETQNAVTDQLNQIIKNARDEGKKIVSVFTSSVDETLGFEKSLELFKKRLNHLDRSIFSDQVDWLVSLINYLKTKENDLIAIIRIHPRMGADKRGLDKSPYLDDFLDILNTSIGNSQSIKVILPNQAISSYQIGLSSDLVLNGWSTIGLEFAIKNCKVINAFRFCDKGGGAYFPVHIGKEKPLDKNHYLQNIDDLLFNFDEDQSTAHIIDQKEACKAFMAIHLAGLVNTTDELEFRSQLSEPRLLTSSLISLLSI